MTTSNISSIIPQNPLRREHRPRNRVRTGGAIGSTQLVMDGVGDFALVCTEGLVGSGGELRGNDQQTGQGKVPSLFSWAVVYPGAPAQVPVKLPDGRLIWTSPGTRSPSSLALEARPRERRDSYKDPSASSPECGAWALAGSDANGHAFSKQLFCGKEWCPQCGEKWSWAHQRRFARWLPKGRQMQHFGYWVIQWPRASRHKLRSKAAMAEYGRRVKGAMVAMGYKRGLRRWHFFGDKDPEAQGYNPHLNLIVDGRFLEPEVLERKKAYLRLIFDEPDLIINYSYRRSVNMKVHTLKYVLRATFRQESWDPEMATRLHNFQNTNSWGTWRADPVWQMEGPEGEVLQRVVKCEKSVCPDCGLSISWGSKVTGWSPEIANSLGAELIGAGYYRLPDIPPPPPPDQRVEVLPGHYALSRAGPDGLPSSPAWSS